MKHLMRTVFTSLALWSITATALASEAEVVRTLVQHPLAFSVQEGVELLLGQVSGPGNDMPKEVEVVWTVTLKRASGEVLDSSALQSPIGGVARFEIGTDAASRALSTREGSVQILVNDEVVGTVDVQNGRVVLLAEVRRSDEGRNPQTGETIQIAASKIPGFGSWTIFRYETGETQAISNPESIWVMSRVEVDDGRSGE